MEKDLQQHIFTMKIIGKIYNATVFIKPQSNWSWMIDSREKKKIKNV